MIWRFTMRNMDYITAIYLVDNIYINVGMKTVY